MTRTVRMVLALLGLAMAVQGRTYHVERTLRQALPVGARPRVVVEHRYGSVQVTGQDSRAVAVEARVHVSAEALTAARLFADAVELAVGPRADSVVVAVAYPARLRPDPTLSYETELVMSIPARTTLTVRNQFGDVLLAGLAGGGTVDTRYGNVELERCRSFDIFGRHGNLRIEQVAGPVKVEHEYGDVVLRNTSGKVSVDNRYGEVDADGPNGELRVVNRFGNVAARGSQGRLDVQNRYGRVAAWIDRPGLDRLRLASEMGQVELSVRAGLPFRLGGSARAGQIASVLPLLVDSGKDGWHVSGSRGTGGPAIELEGLWSDFVIQLDTGGGEAGSERR